MPSVLRSGHPQSGNQGRIHGGLAQANGILMRIGHNPLGPEPGPTPCHASGCIFERNQLAVSSDWARLINCHLTRGALSLALCYVCFLFLLAKRLS